MVRNNRVVRLTGRLALLALGLAVLGVVAIQFEGIIAKNVAVAGQLRSSNDRIVALTERETRQLRTIVRLSSPAGAVPEIHNELRLVGPNEEIIYVRGGPDRSQEPRDWNESQ